MYVEMPLESQQPDVDFSSKCNRCRTSDAILDPGGHIVIMIVCYSRAAVIMHNEQNSRL